MPFSSVLGANSVVKPGVCTSSTRPTVPYEGQLIYETDTDRVASWNGSAWVYTHSSGLVLVNTTTIGSGVTSVTVSDCFSSTYDNYRIVASGGAASATSDAFFYLGNETSNNYHLAIAYNGYPSTSLTSVLSGSRANSGTCMAYSANGYNLDMTIFNPNVASRTSWVFQSATIATPGNRWSGGGFLNTATQHTSITFITQGGHTLTGGNIRVYGYSKN
jgi:hypothetical protein